MTQTHTDAVLDLIPTLKKLGMCVQAGSAPKQDGVSVFAELRFGTTENILPGTDLASAKKQILSQFVRGLRFKASEIELELSNNTQPTEDKNDGHNPPV